ncbi:putative glycosyltransferase isoform X1 [Salvia divinorum]|uniref:Glycosyltransferase isoform X1 n=1 Tax=Salvia divinorum TaxID=28513 RepID=A0ABD1IFR8_SALDI
MRGVVVEGLCRVTKSQSIQILTFTTLAIGFLALLTDTSTTNLSLFSLPSLPWAWNPSSFSFLSSAPSPPPSPPPPPPTTNPNMDLYPTFTNPKKQKAVEKLVKDLDEETMMRRGNERDKNMVKIEADLATARALIKDAIFKSRDSPPLAQDADYFPCGQIYRNSYVFQRSYMLMEKMMKIYVYEEGEPPLFHYGPTKNIYSTEGIFIGLIESNTSHFRTHDPNQAHLYFLPFSVVMILQHLFDPVERDKAVLGRVIGDYIATVSAKYPYWNRSLGADHFMLSCHDWGPRATWYVHHLYFTSIRALCNANTSEFFNPRKDVSFPEINLPVGDISGLTTPGSPNRTILAFFAGRLHGKIRKSIFEHWKEKDKDIIVWEEVPKESKFSYKEMMGRSKYCICPSGFEVASPRIVEAIYAECVPILVSENYVLPFSDVLDWDKFSIQVTVAELPELKRILAAVGDDGYMVLRRRVKKVQHHFVVNDPPKRYDVFNMMLHSLWLRRLNLRINM